MSKFEDKKNWCTEYCSEAGTAFSYEFTEKLHEEQTPYQHIAIYASKQFGNVLLNDGFFQLTQRDNFLYHEMLVHPALFAHDNPKHVVVIGGGDCGTLREVLRHETVEKATQIEIDERVTEAAKKYFPELCASNDDPRAELLFIDGIKWMADQEDNSVDVIIVDSTDPIGPAKGLFSRTFYADCKRVLRDGGIVVQQSESPMLHRDSIIFPMHDEMNAAGFNQVQLVNFPQPCYPTGWWTATMASVNKDLTKFREDAVDNRTFKTTYYNRGIHHAALAQPQFMLEAMASRSFQSETKTCVNE